MNRFVRRRDCFFGYHYPRIRTSTAAELDLVTEVEMTSVEQGLAIDRIVVKNGYGLRTSALSASVIGCFDASSEKRCVHVSFCSTVTRMVECLKYLLSCAAVAAPLSKYSDQPLCNPYRKQHHPPTTQGICKLTSYRPWQGGGPLDRAGCSSAKVPTVEQSSVPDRYAALACSRSGPRKKLEILSANVVYTHTKQIETTCRCSSVYKDQCDVSSFPSAGP